MFCIYRFSDTKLWSLFQTPRPLVYSRNILEIPQISISLRYCYKIFSSRKKKEYKRYFSYIIKLLEVAHANPQDSSLLTITAIVRHKYYQAIASNIYSTLAFKASLIHGMANNSVLLLGCIDGDHSVMREKFRSTMPSRPSGIRARDGTSSKARFYIPTCRMMVM